MGDPALNVDGPELPDVALAIAKAIRDAGGRALVVGGWVRDRLLGRSSKDVDFEVYGLESPALRTVLSSFGPVNAIGESFTVYRVADIDVALPRRESKIGRGHKAFEVTGDPWMAPEESPRRRDFTVNAIAWDPLTGEYIDPFEGRRDLERRVLRMVDAQTFADDSLRVLRGIQLSARYELAMDEPTRAVCRSLPLDDLPAERVWGRSRSCCSSPRDHRSACSSRTISASSHGCCPSCTRSPAARRSPNGIPKGTSGSTR